MMTLDESCICSSAGSVQNIDWILYWELLEVEIYQNILNENYVKNKPTKTNKNRKTKNCYQGWNNLFMVGNAITSNLFPKSIS